MMTENNLKLNREYKDALFKFIFGNEARKEYTLSLFNALNMQTSTISAITV